jgi:phosphoserine phosphatase
MPTLIRNQKTCIAAEEESQIVILMRHGATRYNLENRLTGWHNPPLNQQGREQADRVARDLMHCPIDALYSSDLDRARETAQRIGKFHPEVEIQAHAGLRELSHGNWEGKTIESLYESDPWQIWQWQHRPAEARKPNGETLMQAYHRVTGAFDAIRSEVLEECITPCPITVIVSHDGSQRLMICRSLGLDPTDNFLKFKLDNCALSVLEFAKGHEYARLLEPSICLGPFPMH